MFNVRQDEGNESSLQQVQNEDLKNLNNLVSF